MAYDEVGQPFELQKSKERFQHSELDEAQSELRMLPFLIVLISSFSALDPAETSRLNKILHKKLEEIRDAEVKIDMRSDPRSPLYSNQTFETLNL